MGGRGARRAREAGRRDDDHDHDDERVGWRGALLGAVVLAVASAALFGAFWLRVSLVEADAIDAVVPLDDGAVLLGEHVYGGDGETSLPGGARLVVVDARTGDVRAKKRADGRTLLGRFGASSEAGALWLRVAGGALETRHVAGPRALELRDSEESLRARAPELAALARDVNGGCLDRVTGTFRTTADDGRHVAFDLARSVAEPAPRAGCGPWSTTASSVRLADGRVLEVRRAAAQESTERRELAFAGGERVGVGGLELTVVADPTSSGASPMKPRHVGPHVLVLRRSRIGDAGETEVVRVDLEARREVWSTSLGRGRLGLVAAHVLDGPGVLVVHGEREATALDLATGRALWRRGRGTSR